MLNSKLFLTSTDIATLLTVKEENHNENLQFNDW